MKQAQKEKKKKEEKKKTEKTHISSVDWGEERRLQRGGTEHEEREGGCVGGTGKEKGKGKGMCKLKSREN